MFYHTIKVNGDRSCPHTKLSYGFKRLDIVHCTWQTCCINNIFVLFGTINIWPLFPYMSGTEERKCLEWHEGEVNHFYFRRTVTLIAFKDYSTRHVLYKPSYPISTTAYTLGRWVTAAILVPDRAGPSEASNQIPVPGRTAVCLELPLLWLLDTET